MNDTNYPAPVNKQASRDLAIMIAVMAALFALFCYGLYAYDQSHNTGHQDAANWKQAYNKVLKQEVAAEAQNKALTTANGVLTAKNTELTNEKAQFCTELAKAKVAEPLCTQ